MICPLQHAKICGICRTESQLITLAKCRDVQSELSGEDELEEIAQ